MAGGGFLQLTISFEASGNILLPVHYGSLLQGAIYAGMENPALRKYLHEQGFSLEKRRFKLFTFSRLLSPGTRLLKDKGLLEFAPPINLIICSPINFILQELGNGLLRREKMRLGSIWLRVEKVTSSTPVVKGKNAQVYMLSPLTVYSTLPSPNGRKYTYYYSPFEERFGELIKENLLKKHLLIHGGPPLTEEFSIRPLKVNDADLKITRYRETIIKGWMGEYELCGDQALMQTALDAGLGSKNSQGYGCCMLKESVSF
jgi:CRISPR-associated endoribonuclease Cas6